MAGQDLLASARTSIDKAVAFLARTQLESGDCPSYCGRSMMLDGERVADPSIFPTALIAEALAAEPSARPIRERAATFLWTERHTFDLWRHWSRAHPLAGKLAADADDTALSSVLVQDVLGRGLANRPVFLTNRDQRGLFYTWFAPRLPKSLTYARITVAQLLRPHLLYFTYRYSSARRGDVDAVVNANVLYYLGRSKETEPIITWLLRLVDAEQEHLCDKWYERRHVVWYFFSRALKRSGVDTSGRMLRRLQAHPPRTHLERALSVSVTLDSEALASDDDLKALMNSQNESGAWPAEGVYHEGRGRRRDGSYVATKTNAQWWGSEALTTALTVEALARWIAAVSERHASDASPS